VIFLLGVERSLDQPQKLRVDRAPVTFRHAADAIVQVLREPD
jgi:hypothetical protein